MGESAADITDLIDGENRSRPTQFMANHLVKRTFLECVGDKHWGDDDIEPGLTHRFSDGVIVSQLVGDSLEASDPR